MAKIPSKIRGALSQYVRALIEAGVRPQRVFLYGSYAKNRAHEDSDIDLIIVSEDLTGRALLERLRMLGRPSHHLSESIQAYGFTPEEFETRDMSAFWEEMLETEAIDITDELAMSEAAGVS